VNDPRGLAPHGWHIPNDDEWTILSNFLGGDYVAGGKMKTIGTTIWVTPNTQATNVSGFSALPSGERRFNGQNYTFGFIGYIGTWWSSTPWYSTHAGISYLTNSNGSFVRSNSNRKWGYSVRCVKD
jgi:uncharacterized protein (TIGR02145 family)